MYFRAVTSALLMPVGTLLTVLGLLPCRPTAMGAGNVLLFLGLSLYLTVAAILLTCRLEDYSAACNYIVNISHSSN